MQIGFSGPQIASRESSLSGKQLGQAAKELLETIEKEQWDWLEKNAIGKTLPPEIETVVQNKIKTIEGMMAQSYENAATTGAFRSLGNYVREGWGKTTFFKEWFEGQETRDIGTFIQDLDVFGGVTGPGGAQRGDIESIRTELKTSYSPEIIHSGQITVGIQSNYEINGAKISESKNPEAEAKKILTTTENLESAALLELYHKMRNLLLIHTKLSHPYGGRATRVRFVGIVLFVELIVKRMREWVKRGLGGNTGWGKQHVLIRKDSIKKDTVNGMPGYTMTYHITLENLYATGKMLKGTQEIIKDFSTVLKNLDYLYMTRRDLLPYISGKGKKEAASQFFASIKDANIPSFTFGQLNISGLWKEL